MKESLQSVILKSGICQNKPVAVGVSGGADSLALVLLMHDAGYNVIALSVNHGLRTGAKAEIDHVAAIMADHDIPHHILHWEGDKPTSNIQAEARKARYDLMVGWCNRHDIQQLTVGHHQDDQAETFMLRLARGSGVKGLGSMHGAVDVSDDLTLFRPLLSVPKAELVSYLGERDILWMNDPSNENLSFDRVAIRNFLDNSPLVGLNSARLAETAQDMQRAQEAIDYYVTDWLNEWVSNDQLGCLNLNAKGLSKTPDEIVLRGLAQLITFVSGEDYPPRFKKLQALRADLYGGECQGKTLSGVRFMPNETGYFVFPELQNRGKNNIVTVSGSDLKDQGMIGQKGWRDLKEMAQESWPKALLDLPHEIKITLPVLYQVNGEILKAPYSISHDISDLNKDGFIIHLSMVKPPWK